MPSLANLLALTTSGKHGQCHLEHLFLSSRAPFFVIPSVAEGSLHALRLVEMTEGGVAKYAKSVSKLAKMRLLSLKVPVF